jgi:hypothetical protein
VEKTSVKGRTLEPQGIAPQKENAAHAGLAPPRALEQRYDPEWFLARKATGLQFS